MMPPETFDKASDLDLHLEDSVKHLQELKQNMATDVYLLHRQNKSTTKEQWLKIPQVLQELEKEGYTG